MALASFFADKYPHIRPLAMSASVTHGQTQRKPAVDGAVACRRLSRGVGAAARVGWPRHRGASRLGWPCPSPAVSDNKVRSGRLETWWDRLAAEDAACRAQHEPARTSLLGGDPSAWEPRQSTTTWESREPPGPAARPSTPKHIQAHPSQAAALVPDEPRAQSPEPRAARQGTVYVDDGQKSASRARDHHGPCWLHLRDKSPRPCESATRDPRLTQDIVSL